MPLAREVFATFEKLDVSAHPWVLIGNIINYARDKKHIPITEVFKKNYDIEAFHSEVEADLIEAIKQRGGEHGNTPEIIQIHAVYTQLICFFSCVLNAIQNGPTSQAHRNFVSQINSEDCVITFNWDTLLDRALNETGKWNAESGYGFIPGEVFRDGWEATVAKPKFPGGPKLIKLHGSTNWITSYIGIDSDSHAPYLLQEAPNDIVRVFEFSTKPYACYAGRYMPGYEPFSYGYYPPNLTNDRGKSAPPEHVFFSIRPKHPYMPEGTAPDDGVPTLPLIIPPVRNKNYGLFGGLFKSLWQQASQAISTSDTIFVIGYSFPETDTRSLDLFKQAFVLRRSFPRVVIINPSPERNIDVFKRTLGIPASHLEIRKNYFDGNIKKLCGTQ